MDIVDEVAKRTGLPKEQVEAIINDLWTGVKYYFYKPHEAKYGVMINGLVKMKLRRGKIVKMLEYLEPKQGERYDYLKKYWTEVLTNLNKYGNPKRKEQT